MAEVSLWMWSLKMLKCCVCCEHPSNGKSMMGKAPQRSWGCCIKAEVLHQCSSGSKYSRWLCWTFKLFSLVSSQFSTGNAVKFPFLPPCLLCTRTGLLLYNTEFHRIALKAKFRLSFSGSAEQCFLFCTIIEH